MQPFSGIGQVTKTERLRIVVTSFYEQNVSCSPTSGIKALEEKSFCFTDAEVLVAGITLSESVCLNCYTYIFCVIFIEVSVVCCSISFA